MLSTDSMAPLVATSNEMLQHAVYYHLDNNSLDNALFFAERLGAQDKTAETAFLSALCHFRLGDDRTAYHCSKAAGYRGIHLGCSYVFAQASLRMGLWKDGITALEKSRGLWPTKNNMGKHTAGLRMPHPDSAACSCLLGKLYRGYDDKVKAACCFEESLKMNPLMWDAFTALCDMGVAVRIPNIFKTNETLVRNFDQVASRTLSDHKETNALGNLSVPKKATRSTAQDAMDPLEASRLVASNEITSFSNLQDDGNDFMAKIVAARSRTGHSAGQPGFESLETPINHGFGADTHAARGIINPELPHAPLRRTRPAQAVDQDGPPRVGYKLQPKKRNQAQEVADISSETTASLLKASSITERKRTVSGQPVQSRPMHLEESGAPQRRSARLNVSNKPNTRTNSSVSTVGATAGRELKRARAPISNRFVRSNANVGRVVSGNRRGIEDTTNMDVDRAEGPTAKAPVVTQRVPQQKPPDPEPSGSEEALKLILDLLRRYGYGYQQLSQFNCQDALQSFSTLPRQHQDTPWVLAQMGRAQYEQAAYAAAEHHFRRLRIMSPTRMQDMEVYSTILWHLKRETDLSFLAHELIDSAWLAPEAWCALGNAWSLAKDHEQALRCFKRATQLNPKFAYAYTLQGHEHMANEEYDKALTAFRLSISADRRHYNAYYGIGMVYEKLGNYDKAYTHFQAASQIHPTNAVLICCIGTVLEKQKQVMQALTFFCKATELAPRAAQARFRKARALLAVGHLPKAHNELLILADLAPDDARVHFLLGKLYKAQNDKSQAVRHFTQALSLDPKASQQIKEAIESLEDDDGFEDSMMQ
ncbi:hypothetical protein BD289DRAFT_277516 [Coniella lustricola]|uniref:Uncharacterized protein n=1 Tax=Coniella lustricola TaxID=2025994 RepID=A0A2T3A6M6_9PEZI|nr:hypothetical protein BD289DRAFT_277516 [Coniella lustricola]